MMKCGTAMNNKCVFLLENLLPSDDYYIVVGILQPELRNTFSILLCNDIVGKIQDVVFKRLLDH